MKKIITLLLVCVFAQLAYTQNYYKSSYVPNVNPTSNSLSQGWEYLEVVSTYVYDGQQFVRSLIKLKIYYKNVGNRAIFKATDGNTLFSVQTNPDYQDQRSLASRFEFYIVDLTGNYLFFNI